MNDITSELPRHATKKYKDRSVSGIKQIIIHHSATLPNSEDGRRDAEAFARYHVESNDWPGIGYHYVIGKDGTVNKTNNNTIVSYHAGNANPASLGVCLVGNFDLGEPPEIQWSAAVDLTLMLMGAYGIPENRVIGHWEVPANKSCPGRLFDVDKFRRCLI